MNEIDRLGSPAPEDADFEVACWRCDPPSPATYYARVVSNMDSRETTIRSGHALCDEHLEELRADGGSEVTVLDQRTRTIRGLNLNQSLPEGSA